MALFDLKNDVDYQKALDKLNKAKAKGIYIELTEKAEQTLKQNNYIHLCLAYFGDYFGYTTEYVKDNIFKIMVNPDLFCYQRTNRFGETHNELRHSSDLTKEEMSLAIDRWVKWCSETAGLEMPNPDDYHVCMWLKKQLQQKKYL